ncbi:hypothetical protein [Larkinella ripae]
MDKLPGIPKKPGYYFLVILTVRMDALVKCAVSDRLLSHNPRFGRFSSFWGLIHQNRP